MKKLGGILVGLLGAGLATAGIVAAVKGGKQDGYVDITDTTEENIEIECEDVEDSEE